MQVQYIFFFFYVSQNNLNSQSSFFLFLPRKVLCTFFLLVLKRRKEIEPRHEKTGFLHMRKQRCISVQISAFVFATQIVQYLYFLNQRFQANSHLLQLYSPVCIGPGQKPRRPVFSQRGSIFNLLYFCAYLFSHFVFIDIFGAINFRVLQN